MLGHVIPPLADAVKERRYFLVSLSALSNQDRELHREAFLSASRDLIQKTCSTMFDYIQIESILTGQGYSKDKKISVLFCFKNKELHSLKFSLKQQHAVLPGELFLVVPRDAFHAVPFWKAATWVLCAAAPGSAPICLNPACCNSHYGWVRFLVNTAAYCFSHSLRTGMSFGLARRTQATLSATQAIWLSVHSITCMIDSH